MLSGAPEPTPGAVTAGLVCARFVPFSRELGQSCKLKAKIQPKLLGTQAVCTPVPGCPDAGLPLCDALAQRGVFLQSAQGHRMCQHHPWPPAPVLSRYLGMPMLANIHLSKGAGIPNTYDLHSEIAEEVYDLQGPRTQAKDEDEGCDNGAQ